VLDICNSTRSTIRNDPRLAILCHFDYYYHIHLHMDLSTTTLGNQDQSFTKNALLFDTQHQYHVFEGFQGCGVSNYERG
jgi:hypothetical protein